MAVSNYVAILRIAYTNLFNGIIIIPTILALTLVMEVESILNRWTGELSATMIQNNQANPNFLRGLCETIDKRKF